MGTYTINTAFTANSNALTFGTGTFVLTANSGRTGTTTIQSGTVRLTNAFGAGAGQFNVGTFGKLDKVSGPRTAPKRGCASPASSSSQTAI